MHLIDWQLITSTLPFIKAGLLFIGGYFLAKFLSKLSTKYFSRFATPQQTMLLQKSIFFFMLIIFIAAGLQELNFKLTVLLGSAGIATAAIGFASKTSVSNMISGLFLIIEKSFEVGDTIAIKDTQGKVISIDLLSVKLLTAENTLVRVPNETIISSELINFTHFAHRRCDIDIAIGFDTNISHVQKVLLDVAHQQSFTLKKPEPTVILNDFNNTAINLRLSVWVNKSKYDDAKNHLQQAIITAFEQADIVLPSHQWVLGSVPDSTLRQSHSVI